MLAMENINYYDTTTGSKLLDTVNVHKLYQWIVDATITPSHVLVSSFFNEFLQLNLFLFS